MFFMHFLYVIYSKEVDKFYVGETKDPVERLKLHNRHYFKKGFSKIADDWEIVLTFECNSRKDALFLEKFIKQMKSKKFIHKLIKKPNILSEILGNR